VWPGGARTGWVDTATADGSFASTLQPVLGTADALRVKGKEVEGSERHETRRLGSFAVYAIGPLAIAPVLWMRSQGLLAPTSLWLLAAIILGAGALNLAASMWLTRRPDSMLRIHVRVAVSVLSTGAAVYAAGWGSVLVIAYTLGSAEMMRTVGPRTTTPNMVWNGVAIVLGELAVATGVAPSVIEPRLSHTIALVGGTCLMVVTDVLGRAGRAAEEAESAMRQRGQHFESLIERATDVIGVISTTGTVYSVSPASLTMLGYEPEEVKGRPISMFLHPDQIVGLDAMLQVVVAQRGEPLTIEITLVHRDGTDRVVIATLTAPTGDWEEDAIIVNLHDMTTQRHLEEQLRHDARHDPLTGLLNRAAFAHESERVCDRASRRGWTVGMLFIDLDGFKQINDSFGHETGDRVLVETASRLTDCLRSGETLARLGGDEFAVLIHSLDGITDATCVADRILDVVSEPIPGLPEDARVGASIGIALRSNDGIEMSTLMRQADEAMYSAKRNGRSRWEVSVPGGDAPLSGTSSESV
jgi:diguanylate cyclase (GGDEF)-like protein/PAS domain S-box-containing protein